MLMPAAALDTQRKLWCTKCRRTQHRHTQAATKTATAPDNTQVAKAGSSYLLNHKALAKVFSGQGARRHPTRRPDSARCAARHLGGRLPVRG